MTIKITTTQKRPNTNVDWYQSTTSNFENNPQLIETSQSISDDGLTKTKIYFFPQGFNVIQHSKSTSNEREKYMKDNGITFEAVVEGIETDLIV